MALIAKYAKEIKSDGERITGTNRHGKAFTVHLHPTRRIWPALTARIAKRLGLSREEFYRWWKGGKQP